MRAIYEYDKQKKEKDILEYKLSNESRQKYWVFGFLIILIILVVIIILRFIQTIKLNKKLNAYNEDRRTLIKVLAHDLKNPFSNFLTSIDFINFKYDTLVDKIKKEILKELNNSSHKYYSLLENILSWIRSDSNLYKVKKESIILENLFTEIVEIYKPTIKNKNISLNLNISSEYKVYSDKNVLSAILRNIINNSVKFTSENGNILIEAYDSDNKSIISVSDNGKGMDVTLLKKLFTGRLNAADAEEYGFGFGMQIISEMLYKIDAEIEAESENGKGTKIEMKV